MSDKSKTTEDIPEGYRELGYAALSLCQALVARLDGDFCVHCKWFQMDEQATVYSIGDPYRMQDAMAQISGLCVRYPPRLFTGPNPSNFDMYESAWPSVKGGDRCGEFKEHRRSGEDICAY